MEVPGAWTDICSVDAPKLFALLARAPGLAMKWPRLRVACFERQASRNDHVLAREHEGARRSQRRERQAELVTMMVVSSEEKEHGGMPAGWAGLAAWAETTGARSLQVAR